MQNQRDSVSFIPHSAFIVHHFLKLPWKPIRPADWYSPAHTQVRSAFGVKPKCCQPHLRTCCQCVSEDHIHTRLAGVPSNFQDEISAGGVAPAKLNTLAPLTPAGLPRFDPEAESCSLIFTVYPVTDPISKAGAALGAGTGDGLLGTVNPSVLRCALVIDGYF